MLKEKLLLKSSQALQNFRHSLAYIDALPQLTVLGLLIGAFTGLIIVAFRFLIDWPLGFILPGDSDNFEALSPLTRSVCIFAGTLSLGVILFLLDKNRRDVGVAHVLDRLHNFQGYMPRSNWLWQFCGALICMLSGQSVGREGPAVHMGAGAASQLAQWLRLPHNSMPTIIACGVAAAISACFDTPMAGVIFAMEVIVLEYTIVGFVPVILASVMGTVISRALLGETLHFDVQTASLGSLLELAYLIPLAIIISLCSASYIKLHILTFRFRSLPIFLRLQIAGALTAAVAWFVPQIMGLGYDTIDQAVAGQLAVSILLLIAFSKLLVTPIVVALGVPGGMIGPCLIIGACIGGSLATALHGFMPEANINIAFYVFIGMVAMMAATLNAPLAALVAVLELSYNPNIIFPAMLVIVFACVTTRHAFKLKSIFVEQLDHTNRALDFRQTDQALKKVGVRSLMSRSFVTCAQFCDYEEAKKIVAKNPKWIVVEALNNKYALPAADLAAYLEEAPVEILSLEQDIDLMEIPARRQNLAAVHERANLLEAIDTLKTKGTQILYVTRSGVPSLGDVIGILTSDNIENFYQPKYFSNR